MTGTLYLVALPIGNLEDITLRAIRTLRRVDAIVAEDTRTTRRVLDRYRIDTPFLSSLYQGVEQQRSESIVGHLVEGKDLALVSDAGTPLISDPGYPLVRDAVMSGVRVVPIPGASALLSVLVGSGLPTDRFCFEGSLPRKEGERRARLEALCGERRTVVFYESPHRLASTLEIVADVLPDRAIVLGRELTKRHEEFLRGTARELIEALASRDRIRGECALAIAGDRASEPTSDSDRLVTAAKALRDAGVPNRTIVDVLGAIFDVPRNLAYELVHRRDPDDPAA